VPAVWNKFLPERSANAWKQFLIYRTANRSKMKPTIKQIITPTIKNLYSIAEPPEQGC
jgi:hypothetical protein